MAYTLHGPNGQVKAFPTNRTPAQQAESVRLRSEGWGLSSYTAPVKDTVKDVNIDLYGQSAYKDLSSGTLKVFITDSAGQKHEVDLTRPSTDYYNPGNKRYTPLAGGPGASEGINQPIAAPPLTPAAPAAPPTPAALVKYKDSDAYKNLSKELREFVDISYNLIEVGGEEEARLFTNAITQAKAVADPYYKAQFDVALAEVKASIAEVNNDYETKAEIYRRLRDEILADVKSGSDVLTLDEQASLSKLATEYDKDLLDVADQAAEKGITFATGAQSRTLQEERTTQQYGDVVQSSGRTYNFKLNALKARADRGEVNAQKELDALTTGRTFDLQKIGRNAELILGSSNLPSISGYTATGGIMGSIEENKRKSMISDIGGFLSLQRGFLD